MGPEERVSESYRGLARETPGASLDAAILAASRRALRPSAARHWGAPVSIAAVLVLAFGLTLEMRHEEPGIESSPPARPLPATPASPPPEPAAREPEPVKAAPALAPRSQAVARPAKPVPARPAKESKPVAVVKDKKEAAPPAERDAPAAFPAAPAAPPAPAPQGQSADRFAPAPLRTEPSTAKRPAAAEELNVAPAQAPRAKASADTLQRAQGAAVTSPEMRDLERIAQLRSEGRDAEADRALEDFRRDHPDYRIPEAMWERVKPR